jgi:hypothetical protein
MNDRSVPLAEGQAALFLLEALLFRLIERKLLTREDVVELIENALSAKQRLAEDGIDPELARIAAGLLSALTASFSAEQK